MSDTQRLLDARTEPKRESTLPGGPFLSVRLVACSLVVGPTLNVSWHYSAVACSAHTRQASHCSASLRFIFNRPAAPYATVPSDEQPNSSPASTCPIPSRPPRVHRVLHELRVVCGVRASQRGSVRPPARRAGSGQPHSASHGRLRGDGGRRHAAVLQASDRQPAVPAPTGRRHRAALAEATAAKRPQLAPRFSSAAVRGRGCCAGATRRRHQAGI